MKRRWREIAITVALALLLLLGRLGWGAYREVGAALIAEPAREKMLHYGRAIRWYFPGNPWVTTAGDELYSLGQRLVREDQDDLALQVFQVLRSSLLSIRSFYQPYAQLLNQCNESLAVLIPQTIARGQKVERLEVLATLRRPTDPNSGWAALSVVALLSWIGLVCGFIMVGFNAAGTFVGGKKAQRCGLGAIAALLIWLLALWQA